MFYLKCKSRVPFGATLLFALEVVWRASLDVAFEVGRAAA